MAIGGFCMFSSPDTQMFNDINSAIQDGRVQKLSAYFAPNVDISIHSSKVNISSQEAQVLVEEFFRKNQPQEYAGTYGRNYISGNLTTVSGRKYKVDYVLKSVNNQTFITGMYFY